MEYQLIRINTILLLSVLLHELNTTLERHVEIQKASITILGIAATQYAISWFLYSDLPMIAENIRYIDWLFTTPLLLFTYWKLAQEHGYTHPFKYILFSVLAMVMLGYVSEQSAMESSTYYTLSMLFYGYILYEIFNIQTMFRQKGLHSHVRLGYFFIFGWAVYPLAFYFPDRQKFLLYTVGDFVNKGVYSLMLYSILKNDSKQ